MDTETKEQLRNLEQKTSCLEGKLESLMVESKSTPFSSSSGACTDKPFTLVATIPAMIKSDHIRLTFPTYGALMMILTPIIICRNAMTFLPYILYLTLRFWQPSELSSRVPLGGTRVLARLKVTTCSQFETIFLSAILSEDYEDELTEHVQISRQKENESIRDFAFSYRALCKRWKPSLNEVNVVKMILKNIKTLLASQLRCRVDTVEDLVRLGHQFEKDQEQQLEYNQRMGVRNANPFHKLPQFNLLTKLDPLFCVGDVKETMFLVLAHITVYLVPIPLSLTDRGHPNTFDLSGNGFLSVVKFKKPSRPTSQRMQEASSESISGTTCNPLGTSSSPQQLLVPVSIGTWCGKAMVDTGASYTLIQEYLWVELTESKGSKTQLRQLWESNSQVCTNQPGKTNVLQHTIYTTNCVPIKQRSYKMSPA